MNRGEYCPGGKSRGGGGGMENVGELGRFYFYFTQKVTDITPPPGKFLGMRPC